MFDFAKFGLGDLSECGAVLRRIGEGATCMEDVAGRVVQYLYDHLLDGDQPACALVRFYIIHPYGKLPEDLQAFARAHLKDGNTPQEMKCLTLLGTAGESPEWNDRRKSRGHQALPLPSAEAMAQAPMIAGLIQQLGLDAGAVLRAEPSDFLEGDERIYNVFHVAEAVGSPFIPAQEGFVVPFGVRSVLGIGSLLHSGDLFAVISFSKVPILRETAEFFRVLALSVKAAVLPFEGRVFPGMGQEVQGQIESWQEERARLMVTSQLLEVYERTVADQAKRLEDMVREREQRALELAQARRLESVGRLAGGIAHEINTPIQFVGDNTHFLKKAFQSLLELLACYRELSSKLQESCRNPQVQSELQQAEEAADLEFLQAEIPKALAQTLEGVERVATIVRAMKEFAHPGQRQKAAADVNRAILSTLTVARNEIKYVAEVVTDLGDLPPVICNVGDLNQVFLNLLINAAHAIQDVVGGTGRLGTIRVWTRREDDKVLIALSDSGCGIPEANKAKVFEPFFTTKEVGRGTGQGLALARAVVVEQHRGTISFESAAGKGTTFFLRLPIEGSSSPVKEMKERVGV